MPGGAGPHRGVAGPLCKGLSCNRKAPVRPFRLLMPGRSDALGQPFFEPVAF
jgi:hypothetical protein